MINLIIFTAFKDLTVAVKKCMDHNLEITTKVLGIDIDPVLIKRAVEQYSDDSIKFECLDIMDNHKRNNIIQYLETKRLRYFNITFCFSVTMWIHLNHGDEGLKEFLKYIASISELLVIEPQPWKCYKTAVKRMKQQDFTFPHFHKLCIKQNIEDEIEEYLVTACGLIKISDSNKTKWGRKLLVFKQSTEEV